MSRSKLSGLRAAWGVVLVLLGCSLDTRAITLADADMQAPGAGGAGESAPVRPALGMEPAALNFGAAVVGSPSRGRVAIANTGDGSLDAPVVTLQPGSDADFLILHDQCENSVPPGGRCDVRLQLLPSKLGDISAALGVQSSAQSAEAALTGTAMAAGPLTLSASPGSSSDFGGVPLRASAEAAFDVSNPTANASGPVTLTVNEEQFRLLPPIAGDCQPGTTSLINGQSCRVRVEFTPFRRGGADATLVASSSLGGTALQIGGTGLLAPSLRAPGALEFGAVVLGSVGLRTLNVHNEGDVPLQLGGIALAGSPSLEASPAEAAPVPVDASAKGPVESGQAEPPSAFSVLNSDCGAGKVLAAGQRCNVTVAFRPLTVDANQQSELVVKTADGVGASVALSGSSLSQGALVIAAASGASADFGEIAIGQSTSQKFVVTNPSAQPSGPLDIQVRDDFAVAPTLADGECQSAVTSLVNGQSCAISVTFTPSDRGVRDGGLLVSSVLAGAAHLSLGGRGLALPQLGISRTELDFGRVPTQTPVQQTLMLSNRGDHPLSVVDAVLEAPEGGPANGFSLLGSCSGQLDSEASCELGIQFLPGEATSYAAVLRATGNEGGLASALLLGRAFPRGSLISTPAAGSTDFGDVVLGSSRALDFTLTNPGNVPSGRLALSTSSNAFTLAEGDCNPETGAGLVNGTSCTFSVTFTPTTSEPLSVNLSIQSPGAGETALSLTGRGRAASSLSATGNRDFGSANVNEEAVTNPANLFVWTVTNGGDLASGPLQLQNSNPAEFIVSNDTCTDVSVASHGSCTMDVRFRPNASGARTAYLDATDTVSSQALRLVMTGNGTLIASPGESCVNATCASGVCTGGVCCDRACGGSCQVCDDTGVCADQNGRQQCGNGGVCFGLDRCLLPELQACSGDEQCGAGNCEQRLGGPNSSDKVCCLDDCGTTGLQCNSQTGRCEAPALGANAPCGAAGQAACGAGLECKPCLGGGSQCTPPDGCCGGCGTGYTCIAGECGCPVGTNGQPQIDCGSGQCILNRQNACCAVAPDCPVDSPICDGAAGLCRECLQAADCPAGAPGTFRSCTNNTCVYACSTQQGFKDCNGACISTTACCNCTGPCNTCSNGTCSPVANGQPGQCTGGQVCQGEACSALPDVGLGQTCNQAANNCAVGTCNASSQCSCTGNTKACNGDCIPNAMCCNCTAGQVCEQGACVAPLPLPGLGQACQAGQCAQGICSTQNTCCSTGCASGCRSDGSCNCPASSTFQGGTCDCNPGRSLCSNETTSTCVTNLFDFEDGTLQGWFANTVNVLAPCGDDFSQCLQTLTVNDTPGVARSGTFFAAANGTVLADGVRRLAMEVLLCGSGATTTNLVGQRVSAFMQTGSQGGSPAGTTFSLSLVGRTGPPVILITVSAATTGGAQTTPWTELSAIVPDSAAAREAVNVILSLDIPGNAQRTQSFQVDDVRIGE